MIGAVAVYAGLTQVDKIGASPVHRLDRDGGAHTSIVVDHFGFLRMEVHTLNIWRVLGVLMMIGGVTLIAIF